MNKFINFLERKIGKYAIPNLPLYMIICYAIGYLMQLINPEICYVLSLNPSAIMKGQVWRLVSWVLIPPEGGISFFTLIALYFYFSIGTTLERTWGRFYFNYYIFSGMIFTIIGAFCQYAYIVYCGTIPGQEWNLKSLELMFAAQQGMECPQIYGGSWVFGLYSRQFSTFYVNMSIFLAFAATYPDMQVLLMFIIPIKVKVLGIIYAILLGIQAFQMGIDGIFVIGASLLNFLIFFATTRRKIRRTPAQIKRQVEYKQKMKAAAPQKISKHKCAICGRTSEEYPDLDFRFCSKCEGNYEYCQEHLFTHRHVKR